MSNKKKEYQEKASQTVKEKEAVIILQQEMLKMKEQDLFDKRAMLATLEDEVKRYKEKNKERKNTILKVTLEDKDKSDVSSFTHLWTF